MIGGECSCKRIKYQLLAEPMIVHCCHCRWCQRETGSVFVLNALVETSNVELLSTESPEIIRTPSESGTGQRIAQCTSCHVALWSHYGPEEKSAVSFIRVGTLYEPSMTPPSVHIYTALKQPWVNINGDVPVMEGFYELEKLWPEASLDRLQKARQRKAYV